MQVVDEILGALPPVLVLVVVAALVAGEAAFVAGLVLPSATALVALGLLANEGVVGIGPALASAVAAGLAGGNFAYFAGQRKPPKANKKAERLFERYGGRAVFLGQWVVGARTLVPRLAGRKRVPYRRFAAFHTPAVLLWATWLVGASYLAGASYDVLAARAGRAGGALAVLTALIVALVLAGRWVGRHPVRLPVPGFRVRGPLLVSVGLLAGAAFVLVVAIPPIVRFSGLSEADEVVARRARGEWTSDGYRFALDLATSVSPEALLGVAAAVSLGGWLLGHRRRATRPDLPGLLRCLAPVLPMVILALTLELADPVDWTQPGALVLPSPGEFDGPLPSAGSGSALATLAAAETARLAAVIGLLTWLIMRKIRFRRTRVALWTVAAIAVTVCAGSWVYLGWSRLSETVAAVLLGAAWAALNAGIWSTRQPVGENRRTLALT
ncbi:VTT domain-containing protein [Actinoplanes sp. NPDC048796]|uniref:VTT domain-containing protein n=1 Tax=Actinoplanes sp. NPDC048796 TaxID=3155640 RepID=UPI0033C5DD14